MGDIPVAGRIRGTTMRWAWTDGPTQGKVHEHIFHDNGTVEWHDAGVLGFEVVETSHPGSDFSWALLRLNDAELMLNTAYEAHARPPAPDAARVTSHGDTALFFRCSDVDAIYDHLRAQGTEVAAPIVRDYGMKQLWLTEPDGFRLCFQGSAA